MGLTRVCSWESSQSPKLPDGVRLLALVVYCRRHSTIVNDNSNGESMDELIRTARIDTQLDSYKDFFDKAWFARISSITEYTNLEGPVLELARAWLGASHVHAMPWVFATSVDGLLGHRLEQHEPISVAQIRGLREKIIGKLSAKGVAIRPMLRKTLNECLADLNTDIVQALAVARVVASNDADNVWEELLERNEFKTILWSGERICFAAVYYNYECFLTECLRIKRGEPEYCLTQEKQFKKDFNASFSAALQQQCWSDQDVVIARLARHALVHNGGRMTPKLAKQPHKFVVENDELQIMPRDIRTLHAAPQGQSDCIDRGRS